MMEGILIFIFAACLHFRRSPGKNVQLTSLLSSPGVLETQHSLEPRNLPSDGIELFLWGVGAGVGMARGSGVCGGVEMGGIQTRRDLCTGKL